MGIAIAGAEVADMLGIMFNSHIPLKLAISEKPFKGEFPLKLDTAFTESTSFETLKASYAAYFREIMAYCVTLRPDINVSRIGFTAEKITHRRCVIFITFSISRDI